MDLDSSIDQLKKMYPTLALSGPNITKVIEIVACPPEEAFPMRMRLFGLAQLAPRKIDSQ